MIGLSAVALILAGTGLASSAVGCGPRQAVDGSGETPDITSSTLRSPTPSTTSTQSLTTPLPPTTQPLRAAPLSSTAGTTASSVPTTTSTIPPLSADPPVFDADRAMAHLGALALAIGVRPAGSDEEAEAIRYAREHLSDLGYAVHTAPVPLPNGLTSHNLVALKKGSSSATIILGAHIDSKSPAPGANDNASGVATILELARDLATRDTVASVEFVVFGAEEMIDQDPNHDHYGSRAFVATLGAAPRATLAGMVSVDMVGYGDRFVIGTMGRGPQELRDVLLERALTEGLPAELDEDTSTYGQGDYEPFELAGFPAAWVEWADDPTYHTTGDTVEHVDQAVLGRTGSLLLNLLLEFDAQDLDALIGARR
jgi:aminopeptidase YwaD